jgi:type I restriction-modification system DNA methylase subunit
MYKYYIFFLLCLSFYCKNDISNEKAVLNEKAVPFEKLSWKNLDSLKIEYYYDADYGDYLGKPTFSKESMVWNGKNVIIEGYWIPVSEIGDSTVSVLSALPYAQCFFCSGAGIETVMQIKAEGNITRMETDEKVALKGKLLLNKDNPMELYYQLVHASLH